MKIKWEVAPSPTGRYRSFETRGWPSATFDNGEYAATLCCADEYTPEKVRTGNHSEIVIRVALHGVVSEKGGLKTAIMKLRASTLEEAKKLVLDFYYANPQYIPK